MCRIFIHNFSKCANPLVHLTHKGTPFEFRPTQITTQEDLRKALLASPALRSIDYSSDSPVILAVNTSQTVVGFYLCQEDSDNPCKRYFTCFGLITLNKHERRFSQPKLELYRLFHALHTYKIFIVGVQNLIVEVDARYIKGMLNNLDTVPSASINCWIVSVLTFHFDLSHIPGKQHRPDGLSQHLPQPGDIVTAEDKDRFDNWVDNLYGFMHLINHPAPAPCSDSLLGALIKDVQETHPNSSEPEKAEPNYNIILRTMNTAHADKHLEQVHDWLTFTGQPDDMLDKEYSNLMRYATGFFIDDHNLWHCYLQGAHKHILYKNQRMDTLKAVHDDIRHRRFYATLLRNDVRTLTIRL